ncbi:MAG: ATP synthase F1 subunit epsilon [Firmicutes bacterium]|nr:ATP synthase F1 subunit epsilon [Bacillota bacterium]
MSAREELAAARLSGPAPAAAGTAEGTGPHPGFFALDVVTPRGSVFRGQVYSVVVPGSEGYLGFLPGHLPMIALLAPGVLHFRRSREAPVERMAITGGVVSVQRDRVTVLAEAAELASHIDLARARAARDRALERIRSRAADVDLRRAHAALRRALARIEAAEHQQADGKDRLRES